MYKKLQFKKIQNIRIVNPYVLKKKIRTSHMFCKQHTSPWLNSHTCILKHFGAPKIAHVHILAFLIPTYANFMMNLDYLHNKVLHFMLFFQVFAT